MARTPETPGYPTAAQTQSAALATDRIPAFGRRNPNTAPGRRLVPLPELTYQALSTIAYGLPEKWGVNCTHVGKGRPTLEYLLRYLYRGVIGEQNLVTNRDGQITFRYTDSSTGQS